MVALLVAAFIVYLYVPHLLFKFGAATRYDFVSRKGLSQVEEFFAAGLPSFFLNALAAILYRLLATACVLPRVRLDWAAIAAAVQKDADFSGYVNSGRAPALVGYLLWLGVTSWCAGKVYGHILQHIALAGGPEAYVSARTLRHGKRGAVRRAAAVLYRRFWRTFYGVYEEPFYPIVLKRLVAFVHTRQGLYHGIVFNVDKTREGEIDGIYLIDVSRFSRRTEEECLAAGRNPIIDLTGPLFIKWSEILDVNYPPDHSILEKKRAEYDAEIAHRQRSPL